MKKKLVTAMVCVMMAGAMMAGCGTSKDAGSTTQSAPAEDVTFDVDAEYEPNADYDKYTVFEYTIESAGATFPVTLSATNDESKFEIHCNFYGDEQLVVVEKDGDDFVVKEDKTGFMETDAPTICQTGIDNANWAAIK